VTYFCRFMCRQYHCTVPHLIRRIHHFQPMLPPLVAAAAVAGRSSSLAGSSTAVLVPLLQQHAPGSHASQLQAAQAASVAAPRGLATAANASAATTAAAPRRGSLFEIREYTLHPSGIKDYLQLTAEHAELRSQLLPFLGWVEVGLRCLRRPLCPSHTPHHTTPQHNAPTQNAACLHATQVVN